MNIDAANLRVSTNSQQIEIRPLTPQDTSAYQTLRLRVKTSGGGKYFSDSYKREENLNESQWQEWCTEKREHCIFGIFFTDKLVGTMMITAQGPSDSLICEWEATWLEPEYRHLGIARQGYKKVYEWTKVHGYEHVVVFIRDDNTRSRKIREEQGFVYLRTKHNEVWADGSIADTNLFFIDLFSSQPHEEIALMVAVHRLEKTLTSMKGQARFIGEAIEQRIDFLENALNKISAINKTETSYNIADWG